MLYFRLDSQGIQLLVTLSEYSSTKSANINDSTVRHRCFHCHLYPQNITAGSRKSSVANVKEQTATGSMTDCMLWVAFSTLVPLTWVNDPPRATVYNYFYETR